MRSYRCKCGATSVSGITGPPCCESCAFCKTNLYGVPAVPHIYSREWVDTDEGMIPGLSRCVYCNRPKREIEMETQGVDDGILRK